MTTPNDKAKYLLLDIVELSYIAGLSSFKSLNNKARKQNWPHLKQQREYGSPIHLYPLSGLPDDLQIAWSLWDEAKVHAAIAKEQARGEQARPNRIPGPVGRSEAQTALSMSLRTRYYQSITRDHLLGGHQKRVHDGKSRGLCPEARQALLERFPDLTEQSESQEDLLVAEDGLPWGRNRIEDQFIYVPHYQISASAGFGSEIDSEQIIDHLAFHKDWVRNHLRVSVDGLALINVIGDSMTPTLHNNDLILVDMAQREVKDGLLFVLRIENDLIVKRLERLINGKIKLSSDNRSYSEQTVDPTDLNEQLQIVGRVVWFGREI
ncbi:MAG: S24 family peptidase [bacterium]|nr:S24 family peptidase [bacterium]